VVERALFDVETAVGESFAEGVTVLFRSGGRRGRRGLRSRGEASKHRFWKRLRLSCCADMVYVIHCIMHSIGCRGLCCVFFSVSGAGDRRLEGGVARRRLDIGATNVRRHSITDGKGRLSGGPAPKNMRRNPRSGWNGFWRGKRFFSFSVTGEIYGFLVPGVVGHRRRVSAGGNFAGD